MPSRLRRSPPSYSTVPLRPRLFATLSVSHGDRRMRGSSPLNPTPRDQQPIRLPRKLGQVAFGIERKGDVQERNDIDEDGVACSHLRIVAELFGGYGLPWPGLPP